MNQAVSFLRKIAWWEAVSYLVLLFIAMPLKYMAGIPVAVKVAGSIHGILFIVFGMAWLRVLITCGWPLGRAALVFVASLLPFAPFMLDARMEEWAKER